MKKLTYLFSALALFACEETEVIDQPNQGGTASGDLPEVIYATVADNNDKSDKTRTVVAKDGKSVLWNSGDNITYFFDIFHGAQYKYNGEDGVAEAEFDKITEGTRDFELSRSYAVYPFEVGASCIQDNGVEKLQVFYPAEQNYMPNSFGRGANVMVAAGEHALDDNLRFRNACGYLVIKLYGENITVKSIELTALGGEKVAGKGLITARYDAAPEVEMTDQGTSTITLNCGSGVTLGADAANATEFWFAMPPTTFEEGFKILVAPTTGMAFEMQTSKQVEITRNDVQPMAALQYTPNAPAPNQIIYTRSDGESEILSFYSEQPLDQTITKHYAHNGKFIIECADAIEHINENGFERLPMETIILPNQLESIGEFAFYGTDLVEIVIPGSVTVLHKDGFHNCDDLKRVTFLWGEEDLQINDLDGVFMNSNMSDDLQLHESNIDYMYLDRNIRYADKDGMVSSANKPEYSLAPYADEVIIGPNVSKIPPMAFNGADATHLVIPGNINYIGAYALRNLYELEELVIEPSPTNTPLTIDHDAVYGNTGPFYLINSTSGDPLQTIRLNREIIYNYQPTNKDEGVFSDRRSLTTVVLGNQVKTISDRMFSDSPELRSVTINGSVTSIGNHAFYNCPKLTSIAINNSLTSIGNYAFKDCDAMTTFTVNGSIGTIGTNAFEDSDALANLNIASTVGTVGRYAFSDCDAITTLAIRANTVEDYAYEDMDGLKTATLYGAIVGTGVFYDCDALEEVTIDGGVNSMGNDAFYSCGKIKNVTFEPSTTGSDLTLGYQTYGTEEQGPFYDGVLETVNWNRNISYTLANAGSADQDDEGLFSKMSKLTSVNIGEQVRTIPPYTFANSALTSITIPANVSTIGADAFRDCDALHTVNIESSISPIKIHTQTGDWGTFYDSPLSTINLDREVNYVNAAGSAFTLDDWDEGVFANEEYDEDFTATVTLGANVKTIWPWMFSGVRMQNVTIPASVTSIGKEAFSYCYILTEVTCMGTTPPTLGEDAFYDSDELEHIYVPSGSLSDYQSKWSQYKGKLYQK